MSRESDSRERSAVVGFVILAIGFFCAFVIPEPYGRYVLVLLGFLFGVSVLVLLSASVESAGKRVLIILGGIVVVVLCLLPALKAPSFDPSDAPVRPVRSSKTEAPAPTATATAKFSSSFIYKSAHSPKKTLSTAQIYQRDYPMTWGYIAKYADDPYEYIEFYDEVWGDLQAYHGDGIVFDTLSWYERLLVNYPTVKGVVYFASASSFEYHSTRDCYTLLRSSPIGKIATPANMISPCSKCVEQ